MSKKTPELSAVAKEILEVLKTAEKPLTVAELKEMGLNANPSSLKALETRGLITSEKVEVERTVKDTVNAYQVVKAE